MNVVSTTFGRPASINARIFGINAAVAREEFMARRYAQAPERPVRPGRDRGASFSRHKYVPANRDRAPATRCRRQRWILAIAGRGDPRIARRDSDRATP